MRIFKGLLLLWCSFLSLVLSAQPVRFVLTDTVLIDEVKIASDYREVNSIGATIQPIDTVILERYEGRSIGELLSAGTVSIKSYGVGGLTTLSMRGGGASHTAVVWNGINIQNPMNGGVNLALLPVNFFGRVSLQRGGSGTLYGSGAVTGIVHLKTKPLLGSGAKASAFFQYGSANSRTLYATADYGAPKMAVALRLFRQKSDNNYLFRNSSKIGSPLERISNAQSEQNGLMAEANCRLNSNTFWAVSGWYQYGKKNIQTLMSSAIPNRSYQKDYNFTAVSNLKYAASRVTFSLKNALMSGNIRYVDPTLNLNTANPFLSLINECVASVPLGKPLELTIASNYTYEVGWSDSYVENAYRNRFAGIVTLKGSLLDNSLVAVISVRDEVVNSDFSPVVYSVGTEWNPVEWIGLKGTFSRSYRIPTLNDLYWISTAQAEGNPDLIPESGWGSDLGVVVRGNLNSFQWIASLSFFHNELSDWLVWINDPALTGGKWKPMNLNRGKTNGLEAAVKGSLAMHSVTINFAAEYAYTDSRIYHENSYSGTPMIYVPKHKLSSWVGVGWNGFAILYNHTFTGARYRDAQSMLPYYNLGDLSCSYSTKIFGKRMDVRANVNNIWNQDYQMIAGYAMPLRTYSLSLGIRI